MRNILLHKANKYTFTATCEKLEGTHIHNVGIGRSNFPDWKVDIHIISFPTVQCVCLYKTGYFFALGQSTLLNHFGLAGYQHMGIF